MVPAPVAAVRPAGQNVTGVLLGRKIRVPTRAGISYLNVAP
jgi:hypothetical protein